MSKVYIFLADGFEEIEGLTVVDLLRRAGADVVMVSVNGKREVCGSHKIRVGADALFEDVDYRDADLLVLPGGMPGTKHLGAHKGLTSLLQQADAAGTGICAICAAPSVLGDLGLLKGRKAACYPGFEERLTGAFVTMDSVATDGHITTSRGMGTAIDFGLELVRRLFGQEKADELAKSIIYG
ncbi:MAG: DJ-1/PfpI family protein [Eubacteriales bacterium]|nr:DJ-1/PfpI family protein [Eubacteriales bacterium]